MGNVQDVEVGPIRNQSHAEEVASEYIRNHPEFEWTGHWNTTRPGEMSVIQVRRREEAGALDIDDLVRSGVESSLHSLQQSLTTFLDDSLNSVLSSGAGPSASRRQGNSTRLTASSSLTSDWDFLSPTDNDQDDDTDDDTDSDNGQYHSFPTAPISPPRANFTDGAMNTMTSDEPTSRRQTTTSVDAPTCSEVTELVGMFPETDESIICELLENNDYNVDKTIEDLLQLVPDTTTTQGDKTPNATSNSSLPTPSCPVCYESLKPPKRIFQCTNGHLVCEVCKRQPQLTGCPTCRQPIMGRATAMEQFLADLQSAAQSKN